MLQTLFRNSRKFIYASLLCLIILFSGIIFVYYLYRSGSYADLLRGWLDFAHHRFTRIINSVVVGLPDARAEVISTSVNVVISEMAADEGFNYLDGGTFGFTNSSGCNLSFNFPQNFYTENFEVRTNTYANDYFSSSKPPPSSSTFIGKTYDFDFYASSGTQFYTSQVPATITMCYTDSEVSGYDESTLAPYRWGSGESSWQLISGSTVDTANNTVTFSTSSFSSFGLFGSSPSGGGGGGGGGTSSVTPTIPAATRVILQGKAYPSAGVTILKDGQVITAVKADEQANFKVEITDITAGAYTFGVWAEDKDGVKSITFNFTVNVVADKLTTVSGIFIPPTISLENDILAKGEILKSQGYTAPESSVETRVSSEEKIGKVSADKQGGWFYLLDTADLEIGSHSIRAKAETKDGLLSAFSKILSFTIGKKTTELKQVDLNNDGKVDLVDFSIFLFNWGVPKNPAADFNSDGKVDITDFSVMMYWWTG